MVVDDLDRVFHALSDGTRRDILDRCIQGGHSVSRLADAYPLSFAAGQNTSRCWSGPVWSSRSAAGAWSVWPVARMRARRRSSPAC
jgi:hypothetical protein